MSDQVPDRSNDEQALQRYRYMLATAPPEDIERAHEEAFAQLSPEQRRDALKALARQVPASEIHGDDPSSLARAATRAEMRQPGTIERAWGSGGPGLGSWFLTTLAASFIGTAIAQSFFDGGGADGGAADGAGGDANTNADAGDGAETGWNDPGDAGDAGGGDLGGGDFGDFGGF